MNKGEVVTYCQQYLECSEATFVANIDQFIRMAEDDINRQVQLQELMETSTAVLSVGDQYLSLPNDFLSIYSLAVIVGGEYRMMMSKDHSFMREVYADPTDTGVPRFYAFFNESALILGPPSDQAYTVELNYFFEPTSLADGNDTATSWLSINAEQALLFGTILQGYIYLKGDQDVIAAYTNQYQAALAALKIIAEGRNRKDSYRKSDRRIPV